MSTIKRSNNNLHIGEGKISDPKFIGRVRDITTGEFSNVIQNDYLYKGSSDNPVTDIPDELIVDELTGISYGLFYNTDMLIRYNEDGSFDTTKLANTGRLNTIALTHHGTTENDCITFLWAVDYTDDGCICYYHELESIVWGGTYDDWVALDLDLAGVEMMVNPPANMDYPFKFWTENQNSRNALPGNPQNELYQTVTGHTNDEYYNAPRYGSSQHEGLSQGFFGFIVQDVQLDLISKWMDSDGNSASLRKHFIETYIDNSNIGAGEVKKGFRVTQICSDYTRRSGWSKPIYFQIAPIDENNYTYRWNECVVFRTNVSITGNDIQPVSIDDGIEPVFAPIFYLGTGRSDFDIERPVTVVYNMPVAPDFGGPHRGGYGDTRDSENNSVWYNTIRAHKLYDDGALDDSGIAPNNPNFTSGQNNFPNGLNASHNLDTGYLSWHLDFMMIGPWGPFMRAWDWLMIEKDTEGSTLQWPGETFSSDYHVPYPIEHRINLATSVRNGLTTFPGRCVSTDSQHAAKWITILSKDILNATRETAQSYQNTNTVPFEVNTTERSEAWWGGKPSGVRGIREYSTPPTLYNTAFESSNDLRYDYVDFWGEDWYIKCWGGEEYDYNWALGSSTTYRNYINGAVDAMTHRFFDYMYVNNPVLGVKYPKKSIQFKVNKETGTYSPAEANISFYLPEGGKVAIYKDCALKYGWGANDPSISTDNSGQDHVIAESFTDAFIINEGSVITLPNYWEQAGEDGPFAKVSIKDITMSVFDPATEQGGDPYSFQKIHNLPIGMTSSEAEGASFHHIVEGSVNEGHYSVPSACKLEMAYPLGSNIYEGFNEGFRTARSNHGSTLDNASWVTQTYTDKATMLDAADGLTGNALTSANYYWNNVLNSTNGTGQSISFSYANDVVAAGPHTLKGGSEWGTLYKASSHINPSAHNSAQRYYWSVTFAPNNDDANPDNMNMDKITMPSGNWYTSTNSNMSYLNTPAAWTVDDNMMPASNFGLHFLCNSLGMLSANNESVFKFLFKVLDPPSIKISSFDSNPATPVVYEDQYVLYNGTDATASTTDVLEPAIDIEATVIAGSDTNFETPFTVEYRMSFLYDNFQEGPLSFLMEQKVESSSRNGYDVKVSFNPMSLDARITHINIYRKYIKTDGSGDVLNKFVHSEKLSPITNLNQNVSENDVATYWFEFADYNEPAASYDSIVGISETLKNFSLKYGVSAASDSYLFVTDATVVYDPDYDYSHYIFRSMPGGRFSQFNWAVDYARLEHKPVALETFNGRLFAFTENKLFILNQATLEIEATYDGVGCLGQNTIQSTAYGICFADHDNIYLIKDMVPEVISATISKKTLPILGSNQWAHLYKGWQDVSKENIHISFDNKRKSFLVFFSLKSQVSQNYCWSYNLRFNRWDLLTSPVKVNSTYISKAGIVVLSGYQPNISSEYGTYNNFFYFLHSGSKKIWHWHSKLLNFGAATQDKRLSSVKVNSSSNLQNNGTLSIFKNRATVSDLNITHTAFGSFYTSQLKLSSNKKFKDIQILLEDMSTIVDTIGIVYTPKMPK